MILVVKYFYEKTDDDYKNYGELWDDNRDRMVFFHRNHIGYKMQKKMIIEHADKDKDILAIRWPRPSFFTRNKLFKEILQGKDVVYQQKNGCQKKYGSTAIGPHSRPRPN